MQNAVFRAKLYKFSLFSQNRSNLACQMEHLPNPKFLLNIHPESWFSIYRKVEGDQMNLLSHSIQS